MKKKIIAVAVSIFGVMCIVSIYIFSSIYLGSGNWIKRFHKEFNQFFGEGNWEYLSSETNESIMFEVRRRNSNTGVSENRPGRYKNWTIAFNNRYGEEEVWEITNHVLKINHDKYWIFSPKRYSNKEAMILELMDISCGLVGEEVHKDIIESVLSEEEAACIDVEMSYHGGNPKPDFYDELWEEPWFKANSITAEDFLSYDLHDFYLDIKVYDYRFKKLSETEQENVLNNFKIIERMLREKYSANASFRMYFNDDYQVEYLDGIKQ